MGLLIRAAVGLALGYACAGCQPAKSTPPPIAEVPGGPIACPPGTVVRGSTPPEGNRMWCDTPDGVSHGPFIAWFDDGQKKSEGAFRDGVAQGSWRRWHASGALKNESKYDDGNLIETHEFDADGKRVEGSKGAARGEMIDVSVPQDWDIRWPDPIGVAECDEVIVKASICIENHAPQAAREQVRKAFRDSVDGWRKSVTAGNTAGLAASCAAAQELWSSATAAWGCKF